MVKLIWSDIGRSFGLAWVADSSIGRRKHRKQPRLHATSPRA
ncbi:hypothetical protein PanWU01x14_062120 [Parasponia andersonii]|uniref:Uncharacterized protein n=1 Tax=Parasponia andersonii TaxID=3476 RepID=A0A2P5DHK4_PARAD|nr:hypothetical protein PanWU01x14_062120 [Parasponia andersonii]